MKNLPPRRGVRLPWLMLMTALIAGLAWLSVPVPVDAAPPGAQDTTKQDVGETPAERRDRLRREAEREREERRAAAEEDYNKLAKAYLAGEMDKVPDMYREMRASLRNLSRDQQRAARHMNEYAPKYRPRWWQGTKKQEKNSFEAELWGRKFWANYVPTRELGLQVAIPETKFNPRTGELEIVDLIVLVTWKPLMVDSPKPASGRLAREHGYTLGDIAEVIVWHELGHNYITENIPLRANIELYEKYDKLYSKLHEYYADLAALYHCTPRGRRIALQFRIDGLDYYMPDQQHCRASHGIGSVVIADMLANPDAWPSVRFPPKVPEKQVEVNTIIYIYENLSPDWTVEEDIRLQELAEEYIMKQGERTFKSKGQITLPNKLKYNLMITDDREQQAQRDNWVAGKLSELIQSGRADKIEDVGEYNPPLRDHNRNGGRIHIRFGDDDDDDEDAPKRIDVPWDE